MKQIAQRIFRHTLEALDPRAALRRTVVRHAAVLRAGGEEYDLRRYREIMAVAFGKAAFGMAEALAEILGPDFASQGILAAPSPPARPLPGWTIFEGGHPVPNEQSFAAGRAILDRLARCGEETLVFFLLSGGGSALVEWPLDPSLTFADFQQLHCALVACGAPIGGVNAIRKHLSATKGGRLALAAPRATKITLAITDVPEGEETALASGPTLPDPSTVRDAESVVEKYGLREKLPEGIRRVFDLHALPETPKPGDATFERSKFLLVLTAHDLLHGAHRAAEAAGFHTICDNSTDSWPLDQAADHLLAALDAEKRREGGKAVCVIADGEVLSPVTGGGVGGRNSAFVLACVPKIAGKSITVLSAGTDGIDGNSPAAGALADGETLTRAQAAGMAALDFLSRSDSYNFFARLGDAVTTGPTGNNLRDLRIFLAA